MRRRLTLLAVVSGLVSLSASAAIPDRERAALLAIYNTTGGANWQTKTGWGGAAGTECDWYGVTCDDAKSTVIQLDLKDNNLIGPFPASIVDLSSLRSIDIDENQLTGQIPSQIGQLTNLTSLNFGYNKLTGPIPSSIGALSNLTDLDLFENQLSGPIPAEIGRLSSLDSLLLYTNKLTGPIPRELAQDTSLERVILEYNNLSGPIPVELTTLPKLYYLSLNNNALTGTLPAEIGNLRNLTFLDVSANQLTGAIPSQIGNLTKLEELWLSSNQFTGTVPQSLFGLTALTRLGISDNKVTGSLADFARFTNLLDLQLSNAQFSGPIPAAITTMTPLRYLNLQGNQLTGTIPDFDRETQLLELNLGANQLTGTIPTSLGRMTALQYLDLHGNQLTGTLPPELGSMSGLQNLSAGDNQFTGGIPASFRNLVNLTTLDVSYNQLSGPLPDWFASLQKLEYLGLRANAFSGTIPAGITSIATLYDLDLGGNNLTGPIPADIGRLQKLEYLNLSDSELTGTIPDSLWDIQSLLEVQLQRLHLTGTLSPRVGSMKNLYLLDIGDNELSGSLPPELAQAPELLYLYLGSNRFTGTLPRELGKMKKVQSIDFSANNFRSPIPIELTQMTTLVDGAVDFAYNAFSTSDPALIDFMNRKQFDHDFARSQTVTPTGVRVTQTTDRSAVIEWTPIQYQYDEGGYQVFASLTPGGAPVAVATTSSKELSSVTVRGLQPLTTYFFRVSSVTHPHDFQRNLVVSDASGDVSASTGPRVLAPADVVVTATPTGLVQLDGVPQNDDSFTLTNFGDVATAITLETFDSDFYNITPTTFTLAGGASQTVKIASVPNQPAGVRYGGVVPRGDGTTDDDIVTTTLLSAKRTNGGAIAEAVTSRVEVVGTVGSDSIGTVTFRNRGTSPLTGILVADVSWIVPDSSPITISPGSSALVRFTVKRSRRPPDQLTGALTGTLSLIYVSQIPDGSTVPSIRDNTPSSISITKVTVVDSTKPDVGPANAPQIAAGEVAYFISGLAAGGSASSSLASDLRILNTGSARPVNDLRLYYSSPTIKAVANLTSLPNSQSVTLANVVPNVYGVTDPVGSMQVRSDQWQSITVNAVLLRLVSGVGTFMGELPVFRSDRALRGNDTAYLTGIAQSPTLHATLYLQEISGVAETLVIHPLNASGTSLGDRAVTLVAFDTNQISDLPAATVTVGVENKTSGASAGVITYVRMSDDATGDTWNLVDWSRYYDFKRSAPVRVPVVLSGGGNGKRRAVKQGNSIGSDAQSPRTSTSVTMFNTAATDARVKLSSAGTSKEITLAKGQTIGIADVASFVGAPSAQSVVVEPTRGEIVMTSRLSTGPSTGSAVPVIEAASGLRVGQSQTFAALEDSTSATVNAATPATYRTDYGFIETSGSSVTVRATISIAGVRTTATAERDFSLAGNGFILVKDLVRSIVGDSRDTQFRDLHDLKLQIDVVSGSGSVVPFVIVTDNGSGDASLRLQ